MGKTTKPLRVLVHPDLCQWPEFERLQGQGHVVHAGSDLASYDLIMGPNCWIMDEARRKYLDVAIKEARKLRYPKEGGEK